MCLKYTVCGIIEVVSTKKEIDIETLCVIRPAKENEKGDWIVVAEGLPLSVGWLDLDQAFVFCKTIFGASAFSQRGLTYYATRFDYQRKYRVPNHWSLDEALKTS